MNLRIYPGQNFDIIAQEKFGINSEQISKQIRKRVSKENPNR